MALDRTVRAQEIISALKEKGTEAMRATSDMFQTAEAQLKGATLQEIVNRGKVVAWNAMGMLGDGSTALVGSDAVYEHRLRGLLRTRRIVETIEKEFVQLVDETAALGVRFNKLCALLNDFRQCCDSHITISVEEEVALAAREASSDFVEVAPVDHDSSSEDARVSAFQGKMRHMISELRETVDVNCKGICRVTLADLDKAHQDVLRDVSQAQTAVDLHAHKVVTVRRELKKLQDEVEKIPDGSTSKGLRVMQAEQAEARLSVKQEEHQSLLNSYQQSFARSRSKLHFVLEQSSMSVWSVYNIFFSQMTNFFDEASKGSHDVAKAFASLKNLQGVAKRISEEKRQRMHEQCPGARGADVRSMSSPPQAVPDAPPVFEGTTTVNSRTMEELFASAPVESPHQAEKEGDDFDSFMNQRQTGSSSLPRDASQSGASPSGGTVADRTAATWDGLFDP